MGGGEGVAYLKLTANSIIYSTLLFFFLFLHPSLVPVMGLGTAALMENTTFAVKTALEIGYRLINTHMLSL